MQWNALISARSPVVLTPSKGWRMWFTLGALFAGCLHCDEQAHAAQVYECKVNGQRIFSDQPCAEDVTKREIGDVNTMNAKEAEIGYRASPSPRHQRKLAADVSDSRDKRRERCVKLGNDKQSINSKLRAGYNNNQGERLRERLRKIDAEYYELRCSSVR